MLKTKPLFEKEIFRQTGFELETILSPIAPNQPSGKYLRYEKEYEDIKEFRRLDDPNLPQGVWVHELKIADWPEVSRLCLECLTEKTKDIQLGVWLLESLIHQYGYSGLTSGCTILEQLCEYFWESIYPLPKESDLEHRTNPVQWANENLLPTLKLVPITCSPKEHRDLTWADWERASLMERAAKNTKSGNKDGQFDGVIMVKDFSAFIETTPVSFYKNLQKQLWASLEAVAGLNHCLDERCGENAPSLNKIISLLEELHIFTTNILQERGVSSSLSEQVEIIDDEDPYRLRSGFDLNDMKGNAREDNGDSIRNERLADFEFEDAGFLQNRQQAYAQLQQVSEFIKKTEPHSPVPYLISMAITWGTMSTAELYRELFLKGQGQLSIFDILGIQPDEGPPENQ